MRTATNTTLSMLPILLYETDVPLSVRAALRQACRTTSDALYEAWLEIAVGALVRETNLDRDDALALVGLDDHATIPSQRAGSIVCQAATSSGS
jgi:hypothetical protein